MLHDLRLLLWLRVRHAKAALSRAMHFAGVDPSVDTKWDDRAYQLYIGLFLAVALVLLWAALLDAVDTAFAAAGPAFSVLVFHAVLLSPVILFLVLSVQGLRTSPLKFTHPDIVYLASSRVGMRSIVAVYSGAKIGFGAVVGALAGYLFGTAFESGLTEILVAPLACAVVGALLAAAAIGGAWVIGAVRLSSRQKRTRRIAGCAVAVVLLAVAAFAAAIAVAPVAFFGEGFLGAACIGLAMIVAIEAALLVLLAPRLDVTTAIEESVLFADLQPFGMFSPLDPSTIAEYRRRKKLAGRKLRFRMPKGSGRGALASHAALSLVRRADGLGSLALQGCAIVPLGACALLGIGGPIALLFWLMAAVMMPQGPKEVTRVFREDMRIRLVRDRLPFSALELLVYDSLPAFALTSVLGSVVAAASAVAAGASVGLAIVLALLINMALALCCGLDAICVFKRGTRLCYEMGAAELVAVAGMCSLAWSPVVAVFGVLAVCVSLVMAMRLGRECAR